jgi:hypothetical protein
LAGRKSVALCDAITATLIGDRWQDDGTFLSTPLELIFSDDALLPIDLVLDPVLKHVACLRKLPDYSVAPLAFASFAGIRRKVQSLPDGKFVRCHVLLQQQYAAC